MISSLITAILLLFSFLLQEVVQRGAGDREKAGGGDREVREEEEEEVSSLSPLEVLDRLILHGHEAHDRLSRR